MTPFDSIENILAKGKIAHYEQFTFCHNVFQKLLQAKRRNEYQWNKGLRLKPITTQSHVLTQRRNKALENMVGKGENPGKQHFLLFQQYFLPFLIQNFTDLHTYCMSSATSFNLYRSKFLLSGNVLIQI